MATDLNAVVHIKDENGNVNNIFPATKIANVEGLQSALNAKANSSDVTSGLALKVDKETGKGLSTNDYTTAEKNKLAGIEAQANKTVVDSALSSSSTNPVQNKVINKEIVKTKRCNLVFVKNDDNNDTLNGSCTIVHTINNSNVMIDLSWTANQNNIILALEKNEINHIDYLIITHWHADHANVDNLQALISDGYIDEETTFYIPKKAGNASVWNNTLEQIYTSFISVVNELSATIIIPDSGDNFTVDNVKFTCFNCSSSDIAYFDSLNTDYNNYSMGVYIEYGEVRIGVFADMYREAQERAYNQGYAKKCNVATLCHHGIANHNTNFELSVMADYYVGQTCSSYVNNVNLQANLETAFICSWNDKVFYTNLSDIIFNFDDRGVSTVQIQAPVMTTSNINPVNIYIDQTYDGEIENGSVAKPYKTLEKAFGGIKKFSGIKIIANCRNLISSDDLYISNYNSEITIKNATFNSLRIYKCKINLDNVKLMNSEGFGLRCDAAECSLSRVEFEGSNVEREYSSTLAALYAYDGSSVIGDASFKDKKLCVNVADNASVVLSGMTVDNCGYGINSKSLSSVVEIKSKTGGLNTRNTTVGTVNVFGEIVVQNNITISNGTVVSATARKDGNTAMISLDINNMNLATNDEIIGTISEDYYPVNTRWINAIGRSEGFVSGTYYPCYLEIKNNGEIRIVSNNNVNIKRITIAACYLV